MARDISVGGHPYRFGVAFYETGAWAAILSRLVACVLITITSDIMRVRCAPGTRQRYLWATVEHATIYPTMVGVFLLVASNIAQRDWLWTGITLATALYYMFLLWRFRRDDDDWFNTGGPRRMLARLVPGRRVATQ